MHLCCVIVIYRGNKHSRFVKAKAIVSWKVHIFAKACFFSSTFTSYYIMKVQAQATARNLLLAKAHREYKIDEDALAVDIVGKNPSRDSYLMETRTLAITMHFPEGPITNLVRANFYSGVSNEKLLSMKELRKHMHDYLRTFYGMDKVTFRFHIGDSELDYFNEDRVHIECYLILTHRVQVTVYREGEGDFA